MSHACQAVSQQAISEEGRWYLQVPYAQVNQDGEEIDLNGAVLLPAISPYAEPWLLAGPTPVSPSNPPPFPPLPHPECHQCCDAALAMLHVAECPCG